MKIVKSKTENYTLTIGLEIHAELKTRTKMFCNSINNTSNTGESQPNVNVCPICMGYPGTLPVINKEAVRGVLRLGVALGGEIADYTEFDRKNYFYPDIPKGYQISQYKNPLVSGGELAGVKLTRIHLEEDTARSMHLSSHTLLDFNRAGVPLMELVTEPVIKTAEEATNFAKELQLFLQYLDVSSANMEKGEMRVEANISVAPRSQNNADVTQNFAEEVQRISASSLRESAVPLGTKVEVKNINSFRAVGKTIEFEFKRQVELLDKGEKVVQETRGWDEDREETFSQRLKESAHDYRYFPDPDLPKLFIKEIPDFAQEVLRRAMPELPWDKRKRYKKDFGLKESDIEIYIREVKWGRLLEECAEILKDTKLIQLASNYITSDIKTPISASALSEVIRMISGGEISSRGAKDILKIVQEVGGEPKTIAEEKKLIQISDKEVLRKIVAEVLKELPVVPAHAGQAKGQDTPIQFLVGQAMKKSEGRANPVILQELFNEKENKG